MKKRIVIVGFGDTGLLTAINLSKQFNIVGISPKPCLVSGQELGTRLTQPEKWKLNYLTDFGRYKKLKSVITHHGIVKEFDFKNNFVSIELFNGDEIIEHYDALLISTGVTNGFWRNNKLESLENINKQLEDNHTQLKTANNIAVIGGGAAAVSASSNIKENFPDKNVHLFFSRDHLLPDYHPKTQDTISKKLTEQGIQLHPNHRAVIPKQVNEQSFTHDAISWKNNNEPFKADITLWAVGNIKPNNQHMPQGILNGQGFVKTDKYLRVSGLDNVFCVGDIAATDPNRSSARNNGFEIAANNIEAHLKGKRLKAFKAPKFRWGSILGVQKEGMRVFTPTGSNVKISPWIVEKILFPFAVRKMIYKGIAKNTNQEKS